MNICSARSLMHQPLQARHVAEIGVVLELRCSVHEVRQAITPASHVATQRRVRRPEMPGQQGKTFVAHQLCQHWVSAQQHTLGQRLAVGPIGLKTALQQLLLRRASPCKQG